MKISKAKTWLGILVFFAGIILLFIFASRLFYFIPELLYFRKEFLIILISQLLISLLLIGIGIKLMSTLKIIKIAKLILLFSFPIAAAFAFCYKPDLTVLSALTVHGDGQKTFLKLQYETPPDFNKTISIFIDVMASTLEDTGPIQIKWKEWLENDAIRWLRVQAGKIPSLLKMVVSSENLSYWSISGIAGMLPGLSLDYRILQGLEDRGFLTSEGGGLLGGDYKFFPTARLRKARDVIKKEGMIYTSEKEDGNPSSMQGYVDRLLNNTTKNLKNALNASLFKLSERYSLKSMLTDAIAQSTSFSSLYEIASGVEDINLLLDINKEVTNVMQGVNDDIKAMNAFLNRQGTEYFRNSDFMNMIDQYKQKIDLFALHGIVFCDYFIYQNSGKQTEANKWKGFFKEWRSYFSISGDETSEYMLGIKTSGQSDLSSKPAYAVFVSSPLDSLGANMKYVLFPNLKNSMITTPNKGRLWRLYLHRTRYDVKNGIIPVLGKLTFRFKPPSRVARNLEEVHQFSSFSLSATRVIRLKNILEIIRRKKNEINLIGKRFLLSRKKFRRTEDHEVINGFNIASFQMASLYDLADFLSSDFSLIEYTDGATLIGPKPTLASMISLLKKYSKENSFENSINLMSSKINSFIQNN